MHCMKSSSREDKAASFQRRERIYPLCPNLGKGLDPGTPFNNPIAESIV